MDRNFICAGLDGCPGGWIAVTLDLHNQLWDAHLHPSAKSLFDRRPLPNLLGIDIPNGLTESGPRMCDQEARRLLGLIRGRSVFPAPIRPALHATTRLQADQTTRSVDGRGVGAQAWNLYQRIREIDAALCSDPSLAQRVYEVHPELSFMAWNGGVPILDSKKSAPGLRLRKSLVFRDVGASIFEQLRKQIKPGQAREDDLLDAFAVLWTVLRIERGTAQRLPQEARFDSAGIRMNIYF